MGELTNEGSLDASDLEVQSAKIVHRGQAEVHINAQNWVDARIFSSGGILLHQNPQNMVIQQKGTGQVNKLFPDPN